MVNDSASLHRLIMFTILSDYAYGDVGSPPRIPGGATLTFEVELFEFEGEDISPDKDKSITRRIKTAGEGFDHPNVSIFSRYLSFIKNLYLTTCHLCVRIQNEIIL